jgi:predicted alpha/beta-fold hydrolase
MPLVEPSSYRAPFWPLSAGHVQTILPSYFRHEAEVPYEREVFATPDGDELLLDWSRVGGDRLVVISHGLCGHSRRHYVLSLVRAFNAAGWDCLAWNFRGTGGSPGRLLKFTTNNSSIELEWLTHHALETGNYRKVFYSGYSMGGNLSALYLSREADRLPPEVCGGAVFCATTDVAASNEMFHHSLGGRYTRHFLKDLIALIQRKAQEFPGRIDLTGIDGIRHFEDFDNRYTAPLTGFRDAMDYYTTASACRHFSKLRVPLLMVAPKNDPFLGGECYPVEEARRNPNLYLEMPESGGHCGFITLGRQLWWPARRAVEFAERYVPKEGR